MNNKITSDEISIVIQGPIYPGITHEVTSRMRDIFPNSEIIISTWEGNDVTDLNYDLVIFNKDPGGTQLILNSEYKKHNNQVRMIVSSISGIRKATKKYTLRWRSDLLLKDDRFLNHFDEYSERCEDWKIFEKRVLVHYATHPLFRPFHTTDISCFGLTTDIIKIWDIPIPDKHFLNYFIENPLPKNFYVPYHGHLVPKIGAEPYVWYSFMKKYENIFGEIDFRHNWDLTKRNLYLTEISIANNLQILPREEFDFSPLQHSYLLTESARKTWLTEDLWLYYYKKHCVKRKNISYYILKIYWEARLLKYKYKNNPSFKKMIKLFLKLRIRKGLNVLSTYKKEYSER